MVHTCDRCNKEFKKLWMLNRHLQDRKFPCKPNVIAPILTPIPQIDPEAGPGPATQAHREKLDMKCPAPQTETEPQRIIISQEEDDENATDSDKYLSREEFEYLKALGLMENDAVLDTGIHFIQIRVSDPERPHDNFNLLSNWKAIVPSIKNPAYRFIKPISDPKKYAEIPYMPQLLANARDEITRVLKIELNEKDQIKTALVAHCFYELVEESLKKEDKENNTMYCHHRSLMHSILSENDIEDHISRSAPEIDKDIEEMLSRGSGWRLVRIEELYIEAYTLRRATGGSYKPTPKKLANTKCTINPDNSKTGDDMCLMHALDAYFASKDGITKNLQRLSVINPYSNKVNLDGIPMPTPICSRIFNKIEAQNPNISINVWEWKEETATPKPVIASKNFTRPHKINLMALTDIIKSEEDKYCQKNHFLWIKNISRLLFKDTAHHGKKYPCHGCTQSMPTEKSLLKHQEWCPGIYEEAPQKVTLPIEGVNNFEEFKNYSRMINSPCVIIADFESDNKKCNKKYGGKMRKIAEQKANSFCYMVHWIDTGNVWGPFIYRGENATQEFVKRIDKELVQINNVLAIKHDRIETEEDKKKFDEADSCWICKAKFIIDKNKVAKLEAEHKKLSEILGKLPEDDEKYIPIWKKIGKLNGEIGKELDMENKVWDHCHITGNFRGASHNLCNLKLQIEPWKTPIPIVFHNFRGYDSHLICESVGRSVNAHQIKVIAETFERYKSMKVGQLKYIDSLQFMNNSLANLTKNLNGEHPITTKHFTKLGYSLDQIALVSRKGVYPYDYIDSLNRFSETELPPFYEFHSILSGKINQKDYEHAQTVWKDFKCRNLGDYHDLYLKTDVLNLADVWTKFRKTCIEYYELDPSNYVSAPALSWDAMLKMTGVKIELFTDMSMHDFIEQAKRGGISMACHRYFKANNPKIGKLYDPSKPTKWISYVDATNLYGWAMSQFLPIGDYKWEGRQGHFRNNPAFQKEMLNKILKTKADSKRGYFLNINAHFPLKTHDYLKDLPPAVENIAIEKDWLSPCDANLVEKLDGGRFTKTKKLVTHLGSRKNYVIHYQELQYYVKLGMIVDEVLEILSFNQSPWLAPYIAFNTEKRQNAKNTFEKDFFKLMNNSAYGKTMENVRKYQDVKFMKMTNEKDEKVFLKKVRKPSFKYARRLGPTLIGAHMGKASVTLSKPIVVGASVLGLSKFHMYKFWYGYVKEKYGDSAILGYMDTDGMIFQAETEDIYKDMAEHPDIFNLNGDATVGKFKDETAGKVITESFHLRSKLYHYVLADNSTRSKHKGVSKNGMNEMALDTYMPTLAESLFDNPIDKVKVFDPMTQVYRDCLFDNEVFHAKNVGFRSKDHVISLVETEKKAMGPINDKRWGLSDKISNLPYGHWRIQAYKKFISNGISPELAEKRAMRVMLKPEIESLIEEHIA